MKEPEAYGFNINTYDPCVEKNTTNNNQMTVVWHVEDLNVSHVDRFDIAKFSGYLSSSYGGLTAHRVKVQDYLRMELDYIKQSIVRSSIIQYVDSVLQELPDILGKTAATLDADYLFRVRD